MKFIVFKINLNNLDCVFVGGFRSCNGGFIFYGKILIKFLYK